MRTKQKKRLSKASSALLIALGGICLAAAILWVSRRLDYSPFQQIEDIIYDKALTARAKNSTLYSPLSYEDVVIVDIDNASIQELGRVQQWPRLYDAEVIKYISRGAPLAIGVDILYTESDSLLPVYANLLRAKGIPNASTVLTT